MRRAALVFIVAVFLPSLILAWLAIRSLRDQQFILERQQIQLFQGIVDGIVKDINSYLADQQREFAQQVQASLVNSTAREAAPSFHEKLTANWPLAELGFAVSLKGEVLAPSMFSGTEERQFRVQNDVFLCSKESVEVYWNSPKGIINLSKLDRAGNEPALYAGLPEKADYREKTVYATKGGKLPSEPTPQHTKDEAAAAETEFRQLISDASEGSIARFLQNKLCVWFWYRPPSEPEMVFGTQLKLTNLVKNLHRAFQQNIPPQPGIQLALLNDQDKIVASGIPNFKPSGKPLISAEVGQVLPHWQVAAYLVNPHTFTAAAKTLRLTLGLLIAVLLGAIAIGGWLIAADMKRQILATRQKTDFVSNVSHELKTPLTSIRMFSEMLAEDRIQDPAKRKACLQIITAETSRLTRLINNVLDFAAMERGAKKYHLRPCNLSQLVSQTVNAYLPQLHSAGFNVEQVPHDSNLTVQADADAISQVLVNLLSNAEKYGNGAREIRVEVAALQHKVEVRLMDRGSGVPAGVEEKIFEQFFRAHDSLDSGIQGSGLGLTLARQIARAHGGDVVYSAREGGGSIFTFELPTAPEKEAEE